MPIWTGLTENGMSNPCPFEMVWPKMAWAIHTKEQPMTIWTGLTQSGMNNPHILKSNPVHLKMFDPKWYEQTTCAQNAMSNLSNPSSFEVVWPKIRLEGTGSLLVYIKGPFQELILSKNIPNNTHTKKSETKLSSHSSRDCCWHFFSQQQQFQWWRQNCYCFEKHHLIYDSITERFAEFVCVWN